MKAQRRTRVLWGLLLAALALILLLKTFELIPDGLYDLLVRSWPVLLVLIGLSALFQGRVPFASGAALLISVLLVGGMAFTAYSTRAREERTDQQRSIAQVVAPQINLLEISIETLETEVEIESTDRADGITGQFIGSTESELTITYTENTADQRATFTLREARPNQFPVLEAVGRGRLRLQIPAELSVSLAVAGSDGDITLNLRELALERLTVFAVTGNVLLTLPDYTPLSPNAGEIPNDIRAPVGTVSILAPESLPVRFELQRGAGSPPPLYDETVYRYLANDVLEARTYENADVRLDYVIRSPQQIRVETPAGTP